MLKTHPVSQLRAHEARLALPSQPANPATVASVAEIGIQTPLKVTRARNAEGWENGEELYVVDGLDRLEGAKAAMLDAVPVEIIDDNMVATTILHSLLARKHYTKFALAYLAYPLLETAVEEARDRMVSCQKKGYDSTKSPGVRLSDSRSKTVEELAQKLGVGRETFFVAQATHRKFREKASLRTRFEAQILSGELTSGTIMRAIEGHLATFGKTPEQQSFFGIWADRLKAFKDRRKFAGWSEAAPEVRTYVANEIALSASEWPEEVLEAVAKTYVGKLKGAGKL